jgi:hypothetical protein
MKLMNVPTRAVPLKTTMKRCEVPGWDVGNRVSIWTPYTGWVTWERRADKSEPASKGMK